MPFEGENGGVSQHRVNRGKPLVPDVEREREKERPAHLVEIVHLDGDAPDDGDGKDPRPGAPQLVVARERQLERDAEPFDRHDRDGPDERTDRDVHERVRRAVFRRDAVDGVERVRQDDEAVKHEPGLERIVENLVDRRNLLVFRRVEDDDEGSDEAQRTARDADRSESLAEEECGENSSVDIRRQCQVSRARALAYFPERHGEDVPDQDGQGAERSDENWRCERVGCEIRDFFCEDESVIDSSGDSERTRLPSPTTTVNTSETEKEGVSRGLSIPKWGDGRGLNS